MMGDSDDEYDRRRARDKFRRERSDYQERRGEERGRRDDYVDSRREIWTRDRGRRDYREVDMRRRDRYSPPRHDMSPPMKKMRRDWDDRGYGNYDMGYGGGAVMGGHQSWGNMGMDHGGNANHQHGYGGHGAGGGAGVHRDVDMCPTQPPMMTFKQFLASQDDAISDEEAVRKYNDYKLEFRRQQLNEFFLTHKEEEWFKSKYQPEDFARRQQEQQLALNRRVKAYFELLEMGRIESVTVDAEKGDEIIRLLDAVVIKLEGGSDSDLKVLDEPPVEEEKPDNRLRPMPSISTNFAKEGVKPRVEEKLSTSSAQEAPVATDGQKTKKKAKKASKEKTVKDKDAEEEDDEEEEEEDEEEEEETKPQKSNDEESEENWSESGKGLDDDSVRPDSPDSSNDVDGKTEDGDSRAATKESKEPEVPEEGEKDGDADDKNEEGANATGVDADKQEAAPKKEAPITPRPLHRTCSIFLRNLAPTITKQEVEAMCRRFPGFLRVAIADPQPERWFFRRGWVSFERGVNIKEICWNLNNIRLRDCELGAIVNRDLTRRIRSCNGITSHKQVVRADIKLAAKLIQTLDKRHSLWTEDKEKDEGESLGFGLLISRNPLLKNITDYLIEEADAEEEELLGKSACEDQKKDGEGAETTVERDELLIKVVDRLLLYLRVVHSVDYYNHSDYPNEDEMPNRCGIMHARGSPPSVKVTQTEINEYINSFETKINPLMKPILKLSSEEGLKLGKKDPNVEVEKFIIANTQELGKDKWLCPLSGKKFKGPEFVRKHIFNKHGEKVEEVKREVKYFNNYVEDPKRPHLPEHPGNRPHRSVEAGGNRDGYGHPSTYQHPPPYGGYGQAARMPSVGGGGHAPYQGYGGRGYGDNFRNSGGGFYGQKRGTPRNRGDPREIVGYHDLDAPEDLDLF